MPTELSFALIGPFAICMPAFVKVLYDDWCVISVEHHGSQSLDGGWMGQLILAPCLYFPASSISWPNGKVTDF